jgi:hypothetical protein
VFLSLIFAGGRLNRLLELLRLNSLLTGSVWQSEFAWIAQEASLNARQRK